jgi:hypothetical protein
MIEDMGASEADVTEYQDVIISHHFVRYLATGHNEISATIVRKDGRCRGTMASQKYPAIESTFIESTSTDLYVRYGEPGTERFVVRPGITLTAGYGFDRTACQMVIEPTRSIIPRVELATYMLPEVVTAIIDEVLPEPDRGELILGVVTKSGCNDLETLDYQNVTITRFRHKCELPKPEIEGAANIKRKGPGCGDNGK